MSKSDKREMNKGRYDWMGVVLIGALIVFSIAACSDSLISTNQPTTPVQQSDEANIPSTNSSASGTDEDTLLLAYTLIDHPFQSQNGQVSGTINDFILDLRTGSILFAEISHGGFLDIGDTDLLIPLRAMQWDSPGQPVLLTFDEQLLKNYPDLTAASPRLDAPNWYGIVTDFWDGLGFGSSTNGTETSAVDPTTDVIVRASDLLSFSLIDIGIGVGRVHNLVIDLNASQAPYLLVGFGPAAMDDDAYMIPFDAIDIMDVNTNEIALNTELTAETLVTAPRFDRSLFAAPLGALDPAIIEKAHVFWSEQEEL